MKIEIEKERDIEKSERAGMWGRFKPELSEGTKKRLRESVERRTGREGRIKPVRRTLRR